MSKRTKQTKKQSPPTEPQKQRPEVLESFDVKNHLSFAEDFKIHKNNKYVNKSLAILNTNNPSDKQTLCLLSKVQRFSFGLRDWERGSWTFHILLNPTLEPDLDQAKAEKKGTDVLRAIERAVAKRLRDEVGILP